MGLSLIEMMRMVRKGEQKRVRMIVIGSLGIWRRRLWRGMRRRLLRPGQGEV
jgi:hypothetical protein